uniref:Uncharacterized protein n=1 Tax=Trypanosoma vivax (strain Y486) TaxID=1055687 RepID=G0UA04_TRYVY|nr:hypothetical protein, unlikely [Trypanosoma vivax Y486]
MLCTTQRGRVFVPHSRKREWASCHLPQRRSLRDERVQKELQATIAPAKCPSSSQAQPSCAYAHVVRPTWRRPQYGSRARQPHASLSLPALSLQQLLVNHQRESEHCWGLPAAFLL